MTVSLSKTLELSCQLMERRSITPDDAGCQSVIAERLEKLGFEIQSLPFGEVTNLWARKGISKPLFVFAGHTDVVSPGTESSWQSPPFKPTIENGVLYGRGAADMKTAIAAFIVAVESFLQKHPQHQGSIAFLITSDEEGDADDGTVKVIEHLQQKGQQIDFCIVGESTAVDTVGDTIKNGRRGSLNGKLTVKGIQGHVAYPEKAENPIHRFAPALTELCTERWDDGNEFFSPTTFQVSNLNSGTGAVNVVPGDLQARFNFRFSSSVTAEELQTRVHAILDKHGLKYDLEWRVSGKPFLTTPGRLTEATAAAIEAVTGVKTELSTSGGTSDARFIAPTGAQVIELGLVNASIHKVNEHASIQELEILREIYEQVLERLLV